MSAADSKSITTKTGDKGTTHLFSGETISKHAPQTEAYGDLDEVVSALGIARSLTANKEIGARLVALQRGLFVVGAELATSPERVALLKERVDETMLDKIERDCAELEAALPLSKGFVLPGGTTAAAHMDLARAVARRCERKAVALKERGWVTNEALLIWLNRLSDYLWLMARLEEGGATQMKDE